MFGKLYTFYSIKWVYLIAIAVFEVGSVVCGAAPNSVGLILGRTIAGLGGAGIFSGSMLIIAQTMPLERRPICTGLLGGLYGVAGVAGPLMGGAFTEYVTWRWCFYINIPLGAVTALFILCFFKAPKPIKMTSSIREQFAQLDLLGLLFFIPAIVSILLALQWGGTQYSWGNGRIIGLIVTFGVLISIFIAIQWKKQETATVNPRLVNNRNVSGAAFYCFCLTGSFIVFTYYVSENRPSDLSFLLLRSKRISTVLTKLASATPMVPKYQGFILHEVRYNESSNDPGCCRLHHPQQRFRQWARILHAIHVYRTRGSLNWRRATFDIAG